MRFIGIILVFLASAAAQVVPGQYIVVLQGEPAAASLARQGLRAASATRALSNERARVRQEQAGVRAELARRGGRVTGSVDVVANALIVQMPADRVAQLRSMPGVRQVYPVHRTRKVLDRALPLHHITDVWSLLPNGVNSAGAGARVAILDTGIASNHPAFQDASLTAPSGFPKFDNIADQALTNSKIIVARNYTDDPSADDIDGHGTAVAMCAAGGTVTGPFGTITGAAPKAYLGVYKIFGGSTSTDAMSLQAINDAVADGMDVINLSVVTPAPFPVEEDPIAQAVEKASAMGVIVVSSAGNEGPEPNTIDSPATAPSAIGVGSSRNDRDFFNGTVVIANAPPYPASPGDNSAGGSSVSGPLADVAALDPTGQACGSLPANSLAGKIALVMRGNCTFELKLNGVQAAGAIATVFYLRADVPNLSDFGPWTQGNSNLPALFVSNADGTDLKNRIAANSGLAATLQFTFAALPVSPHQISGFSSGGPGVGFSIKPDLLAVGDPVSLAAEPNDAGGELFDPSGFAVASGTSFSSPIVAGSVAVLKAARPGLPGAQYRSLIVNSASPFQLDGGGTATVQQAGTGILNLLSSFQNTITASPVSLSFGTGGATVSASQGFTISNTGAASDTLSISVVSTDGKAVPSLSANTVTVPAGASQTLTLQLNASGLAAGAYQGYVRVQSSKTAVETHIPYWYAVPGDAPAFIGILIADQTDAAGTTAPQAIIFRVTDASGVPFTGVDPQVTVVSGGGAVRNVYPDDPSLPGTYDVDVRLGRTPGLNVFQISAGAVTKQVVILGQ